MAVPVADIGPGWPSEWFTNRFETACAEFPFDVIAPVLNEHCRDGATVALHWPWIAIALKRYRDDYNRGRHPDDISMPDIERILQTITDHARGLNRALSELNNAGEAALANDNQRKWIAICRARATIANAFDETQQDPADGDPESEAKFFEWGLAVEDVAQQASDAKIIISQDARARSERGQLLPGLGGLVALCGAVWFSMTGRKPSAERVKVVSGEAPPFVRFLVALCASAGLVPPTISQVKTALRSKV
jgi:hypothetical protein